MFRRLMFVSLWLGIDWDVGAEVELAMHDGTVRDVCFIEDMSNKSSLLVSAGAGDCKIYVTDCASGTPFQALSGHSGMSWSTIELLLPLRFPLPFPRPWPAHKHFWFDWFIYFFSLMNWMFDGAENWPEIRVRSRVLLLQIFPTDSLSTKKMTRKWPKNVGGKCLKNDLKMPKKWPKNDLKMT